jgi:LmbE family N-acetylglucosaminyl deacetylase
MLAAGPTRHAGALPGAAWAGRVAVVSPHLDDAVLSVGASMRAAVRRGAQVDVVTVLAGHPDSATPSDDSNRRAGFSTAGEAARARRAEDGRACRDLGVTPVWLHFSDDLNDRPPDAAELARTLAEVLGPYDAVLLPGFPLAHPQHERVSRAALGALGPGRRIGLYVEQPYSSWMLLSRRGLQRTAPARNRALRRLGLDVRPSPRWLPERASPGDWALKSRAIGRYRSQLRVLRRAPRLRIAGDHLLHGGEVVLWCRLEGEPLPADG